MSTVDRRPPAPDRGTRRCPIPFPPSAWSPHLRFPPATIHRDYLGPALSFLHDGTRSPRPGPTGWDRRIPTARRLASVRRPHRRGQRVREPPAGRTVGPLVSRPWHAGRPRDTAGPRGSEARPLG